MKLQTRLNLLFVFSFLFFVGSQTAFYTTEMRRLEAIVTLEAKDAEKIFNSVEKLLADSLETLAFDYGLWDEMVTFLETGNKEWAKVNLGGALSVFKVDAFWVYKIDGSPFYFINSTADSSFDTLAIPQGAVHKLLGGSSRFCHFFINTSKGIMEVRGATIHNGFDRQRKGPPKGYLFVGRIWSSSFIKNLAELTATEINLDSKFGIDEMEDNYGRGVIMFSRVLNGWNGLPVAITHVKSESKTIKAFGEASWKMFFILLIFAIIILSMMVITIVRWVITPLRLFLKAFSEENTSVLNEVTRQRDEFGRIAIMLQKFFDQRRQLINEITIREKTEDELRTSEERFLKIFRSNPSLMTISLLKEGTIIDVNETYLRTMGFTREEMIGHTTVELGIMDKDIRAEITDILHSKKFVHDLEIMMKTKSGEERAALFSAEVIMAGGEEIMLAVSNDITDRKYAEEELKKKLEDLERFNRIAVGRELRMVELKEELRKLEEKLRKCQKSK